jgi:hypothetical protein
MAANTISTAANGDKAPSPHTTCASKNAFLAHQQPTTRTATALQTSLALTSSSVLTTDWHFKRYTAITKGVGVGLGMTKCRGHKSEVGEE